MTPMLVVWSHALAALVFGALALAQGRRSQGQWPHVPFVIGLALTSLWALAVAGIDARDVSACVAEAARTIAWLAFMLALVRRDRAGNPALGAVYVVVMAVAAGSGVLAIVQLAPFDLDAIASIDAARLVFRMMAAVSALVLVHHLYQAAPPAHGGLRLGVLALGLMWSADLAVSTAGYLQVQGSAMFVIGRGIAVAGVALLLVVAVHRSGDWTLALSRPIAVRALGAVAVILYGGATMLATRVADAYAGPHARLVQAAIVVGATAGLVALLSTPWLRAWTRVMVAKHLFHHRYDYRAEWQRFTETLGKPGDTAAPLDVRVVKAVADLTDSPGGYLLIADGPHLGLGATWNWQHDNDSLEDEALAQHLATSTRIVELDRVRAGTAPEDDSVPAWLHSRADAWVIVPMLHAGGLVGAIVLARPPVDRALDWEDFDLLRVAGRQAASHLAEHRAQAALADAQRFDEFNRRFAFIIHDIKNLVSQLTLVARNAERHADNPDFRADMVATLQDSSDRMNALLARLSQHHGGRAEPLSPIDASILLARVANGRRAQHPIVARGEAAIAFGQLARLEQVLGHLVQNAIEASGPDDAILLSVETIGAEVAIDVIDHGCGMTPGFVRDMLFRPFVSSKPAGFGIGAFEARQLVAAMGGRIEVASRDGEGTRFRILLPAATSLEAAA